MSEEQFGLPVISREGWGDGPWDEEDDIYVFDHAGLPCRIARNHMGSLCGYVGVPSGHPAYRKPTYDDELEGVCPHGGITWTDHEVAGETNSPFWWIGFDCNHFGDASPAMRRYGMFVDGHYRDAAYVRAEVERMADQLAAMTPAVSE